MHHGGLAPTPAILIRDAASAIRANGANYIIRLRLQEVQLNLAIHPELLQVLE